MKKIFLALFMLPVCGYSSYFTKGAINPKFPGGMLKCPNVICAGDDQAATYESMCRELRRDGIITEFRLPVLFAKFRNSSCICYCDGGSVDAVKYGWN